MLFKANHRLFRKFDGSALIFLGLTQLTKNQKCIEVFGFENVKGKEKK